MAVGVARRGDARALLARARRAVRAPLLRARRARRRRHLRHLHRAPRSRSSGSGSPTTGSCRASFAIGLRLDAVAAHGHLTPHGRAVARAVVEEPAGRRRGGTPSAATTCRRPSRCRRCRRDRRARRRHRARAGSSLDSPASKRMTSLPRAAASSSTSAARGSAAPPLFSSARLRSASRTSSARRRSAPDADPDAAPSSEHVAQPLRRAQHLAAVLVVDRVHEPLDEREPSRRGLRVCEVVDRVDRLHRRDTTNRRTVVRGLAT